MTREEVESVRDLAAAADDLDTGSLDAFRAAATPALVYGLAVAWLLQEKRKR